MAQRTVLLIDYEPRSIEDTRRPLQEAGYQVEIAHDGISGLEAFHRLHPDLVVVEAMLPKKHGFDVCQAIKNSPDGKDTPVVITTGVYRGRKYRNQAVTNFGCDEYLEKPFTDEALLDACNKFIRETIVESTTPSAAAPSTAPAASSGGNDLEAMTEDEISARLDSLLADFGTALDDAAPAESQGEAPAPAPGQTAEASATAPEPETPPPLAAPSAAVPEQPDEQEAPFSGPASAVFAEPPPSPPAEVSAAPSVEAAAEPGPPMEEAAPAGAVEAPVLEMAPEPFAATPDPETSGSGKRMLVWGALAVVALVAVVGGAWAWLGRGTDAPTPATPPVARTTPQAPAPIEPGPEVDTMFVGPPLEAAGDPIAASEDVNAASVSESAGTDAAPVRIPASDPPAEVAGKPEPAPAKVDTSPKPTVQPSRSAAIAKPAEPTPTPPAEASPEPAPVTEETPAASGDPVPDAASSIEDWNSTSTEPVEAAGTSGESEVPGTAVETALPQASTIETPEPVVVEEPSAVVTPEPPPVARAGDLVPLTEVDQPPVAVKNPSPEYHPMARQLRQQGTVVLNVLVAEDGTVEDVQVLREIPRSRLNDSAVRAVRGWRYRPALKDSVPVKVWKTEAIHFRL